MKKLQSFGEKPHKCEADVSFLCQYTRETSISSFLEPQSIDCLFENRKIAVCFSGFRYQVITGSLMRLY